MYQEPLLTTTNDRFTEGPVLVNSTISQTKPSVYLPTILTQHMEEQRFRAH